MELDGCCIDGYCYPASDFPGTTSVSLPDPTDDEIGERAYEYWMKRGCPSASPEVDWDLARCHLFQERDAREWDIEHDGDWNARPPPGMWLPDIGKDRH